MASRLLTTSFSSKKKSLLTIGGVLVALAAMNASDLKSEGTKKRLAHPIAVLGMNVNVREASNSSALIVAKVSAPDSVDRLGLESMNRVSQWISVRTRDGHEGYIFYSALALPLKK